MAGRVSRALSRAVRAGDRRAVLEALQARLAKELEEASAREVAPLTGRLLEIMAKLDELEAPTSDSPVKPADPAQELVDEVARKRNRRATDQARPAV